MFSSILRTGSRDPMQRRELEKLKKEWQKSPRFKRALLVAIDEILHNDGWEAALAVLRDARGECWEQDVVIKESEILRRGGCPEEAASL
jgi:hypothetical protein